MIYNIIDTPAIAYNSFFAYKCLVFYIIYAYHPQASPFLQPTNT